MSDTRAIQDHALEIMSDAESLRVEDRLWWTRGRKAIIHHFLERAKRIGATSTIMGASAIRCSMGWPNEANRPARQGRLALPGLSAIGPVGRILRVSRRLVSAGSFRRTCTESQMRPTIMDIGCGSGGNLETLARHGKVFGVEPSETLASRARARGVAEAILQQDARELPECREVDLFTMFDVLEHIEDDLDFLTCLRAKAAHRHQLLISVPACQFLYSDHDRILHHYRRYTRKALRSTLRAAGYRVLEMNYFLALLFPFVLLSRLKGKILAKLGRKTVTVDISDVRPLLAGPLESTLHIEAFLSRWVRFPVGLWLFALVESTADGPRTGASATECHSRP